MSSLVDVTVETLSGKLHVFPDMPRDMLDTLLKDAGWVKTGRLVLVNVSASVLTIEARIVRCVSYDGAVRWRNAAALPELPDAGRTQ